MTPGTSSLRERILKVFDECLDILSEHSDLALCNLIKSSAERLNQPMQLAIIGKISSSKSTLVNAILGQAEVVRTGQMEETFNVSWIKYGDSESDIRVVFKNGQVTVVPRNDWAKWTSHQVKNSLKEKVRYIEVFYNHEILKEINIIDTPGLDASTQIDSKNTIAFLKNVKPDAVVMLFTKSIAETTMSVLQDFQNAGTGNYNLTALNAIGVLAKIDTIWSSMRPAEDILSIGRRVIKNTLYDKYPEVRKSLFSIMPVSALMGLAASSVSLYDVDTIRKLSVIDDSVLLEMLSSPDFFAEESYETEVSSQDRKSLCAKYGLYGIYTLIDTIRRNKDANVGYLSAVLNEKSGFGKLLYTVHSHFGGRATLIKSQNALQDILREIQRTKLSSVSQQYRAVADVEALIVTALLSLHEYREWKYLSSFYEGKLDLPEDVAEEFVSLCGEKGYSAKERLRCAEGVTPDEMAELAKQRALYWQRQYNIFSVIDPEVGDFYRVLVSSYNLLIKNIKKSAEEYASAKSIIERSSRFLGLNN